LEITMSLLDENLQQHFAAIVEGSDDAIVAKDLGSIILSWNPAAERMFGYRSDEVLGRSITLIIPEDRQHEEVDFISRLRRGERIQHFETVRRKKNGQLFPISVSISPIRDRTGRVVGASKIARDITARPIAFAGAVAQHDIRPCPLIVSSPVTIVAATAEDRVRPLVKSAPPVRCVLTSPSRVSTSSPAPPCTTSGPPVSV
jgi:PAS domain S-box-containing protein